MKRSWLVWLRERLSRRSKQPWACFETTGPDPTGKLAFSISWNKAFVDNLQRLGMSGVSDEETIQMFFLQLRMLPDSMAERNEDVVNPEATPNLTSEANQFRRG